MSRFDPRLFLTLTLTTEPAFVDAAPVRTHLLRLAETGIGYKRAALLAEVSPEAVRVLIYGRRGARAGELPTRVSRINAHRLLALPVEPAAGYLVGATGARRRVQALIVMGWSQAKLAERLGVHPGTFGRVLRQDSIRATAAAAIAVLFDELWNVQPPLVTAKDREAATRARSYSRALGWQPPLAWDDIDNDDEPATVDPGVDTVVDQLAVDLAVAGERVPLNPQERRLAVQALNARRMDDTTIAEHLAISKRGVQRARADLNLPAVVDNHGHVITA